MSNATDATNTIKQILSTNGLWHLVMHDSNGGDGAVFLPVACWAIVSQPGRSDRVVPMVVNPEAGEGMLHHFDPDITEIVGIAEPGTEIGGTWDDIARQQKTALSADDDRTEREEAAERIATTFSGSTLRVLRELIEPGSTDETAINGKNSILCELAEYGCITAERTTNALRHTWHATALGRAVIAFLDKRAR